MTDRELMQQAVEALERYSGVDQRACDAEEALRERLAQPEQEPVACQYAKDVAMPEHRCATKCQYAQPEQEPVAWMYRGIRHDDTPHERPSLIWKPEYMDVMSAEKGAKATPLYTTPRQWQGLTDKEIVAIELNPRQYYDGKSLRFDLSLADFARAIEAKLKEKNT